MEPRFDSSGYSPALNAILALRLPRTCLKTVNRILHRYS